MAVPDSFLSCRAPYMLHMHVLHGKGTFEGNSYFFSCNWATTGGICYLLKEHPLPSFFSEHWGTEVILKLLLPIIHRMSPSWIVTTNVRGIPEQLTNIPAPRPVFWGGHLHVLDVYQAHFLISSLITDLFNGSWCVGAGKRLKQAG